MSGRLKREDEEVWVPCNDGIFEADLETKLQGMQIVVEDRREVCWHLAYEQLMSLVIAIHTYPDHV